MKKCEYGWYECFTFIHNSSYFALPHVDLACKNVDNLLRKRETAKLERANTVCKTAKLGTRGGGGGGGRGGRARGGGGLGAPAAC